MANFRRTHSQITAITSLTEGENPASFTTLEKSAGSAAKVNQVKALALNDNDAFVWYGGGRDFYDSKDTENPTTYTLKLPGNVGGTSTVNYDVSAQSSNGAVTVKSDAGWWFGRIAGTDIAIW